MDLFPSSQDMSHVLQFSSLYFWIYFHLLTVPRWLPSPPTKFSVFSDISTFQMIPISSCQLPSEFMTPCHYTVQIAHSILSVAPRQPKNSFHSYKCAPVLNYFDSYSLGVIIIFINGCALVFIFFYSFNWMTYIIRLSWDIFVISVYFVLSLFSVTVTILIIVCISSCVPAKIIVSSAYIRLFIVTPLILMRIQCLI